MSNEVYVIAAPSGTGKTSLFKALLARVPELALSISDTTRPARPGEVDGEQYHFISRDEFDQGIRDHRYLEYAEVFGHYYGTRVDRIQALWQAGRAALLEIDVQGASQVRKRHPGACHIFILPPSLEILSQRLTGRGSDPPEVIARRLSEARQEMRQARHFDYILINDDFERALADLQAVVRAWPLRAERQFQLSSALFDELLS